MENNSNLVIEQEQLQTELNACSVSDSVLKVSNSIPLESDDVSDIRNHISPLTIVINVGNGQHDKTWVEKRFGIKKWYPIPEHHMCTDKRQRSLKGTDE